MVGKPRVNTLTSLKRRIPHIKLIQNSRSSSEIFVREVAQMVVLHTEEHIAYHNTRIFSAFGPQHAASWGSPLLSGPRPWPSLGPCCPRRQAKLRCVSWEVVQPARMSSMGALCNPGKVQFHVNVREYEGAISDSSIPTVRASLQILLECKLWFHAFWLQQSK